MKKVFLFAAVAAIFAACSSNNDLSVANNQPTAAVGDGSVSFDAYIQRSTTRGGETQDITKAKLQEADKGFGVFGYYTDNRDYDQLALPNFFYNDHVHYSASAWTYSPVKYWPNEYGYNAISDDADKVTFFAYAPYVEVTPATGKVTANDDWGIVGMTRNSTAGDPIVKYIGSFDNGKAVDLLWGVCQQNDWQLVEDGQAQTFTIGKPWLNVQRPGDVNQKLKFMFRHATAKMKVTIDEFKDDYTNSADHEATQTKIWVRSVRFTGFTMKGALNLNNEEANKPYWLNYNGLGDLSVDEDVIVYDGRKDGKEGVAGAVATNEKTTGLNPTLIEIENLVSGGAWTSTRNGVTKEPVNLFEKTGGVGTGDHFYVIPTGDDMEVEIVYDVETISPNLATTLADGVTTGSAIENRISKKITFGSNNTKLEAGKAYEIKLHLGMNSVKFDADVVDWEDMADPDIDLPANMPAYAKAASLGTIEIPGADDDFYFAVTGLKGGEAVTVSTILTGATATVGATGACSGNSANASGVAYVHVSNVTKNQTIMDNPTDDAVTITDSEGHEYKLKVVQKASPLVFAPASTPSGTDFTWVTNPAWGTLKGTASKPALNDDGGIKVWLDGALLTVTDAAPTKTSEVQLTWDDAKLTFFDNVNTHSTVKIYLKAGHVPASTVTYKATDGTIIP